MLFSGPIFFLKFHRKHDFRKLFLWIICLLLNQKWHLTFAASAFRQSLRAGMYYDVLIISRCV